MNIWYAITGIGIIILGIITWWLITREKLAPWKEDDDEDKPDESD